jgi:hypothetical protein
VPGSQAGAAVEPWIHLETSRTKKFIFILSFFSLFLCLLLPSRRSQKASMAEQGHNTAPGVLVFAGCGAWSMAGRSGHTSKWDGRDAEGHTCWGFHRIGRFVSERKKGIY